VEDKNYQGLRKALIAILGDLKEVKKNGKAALRYSSAIGGPLKKETAVLMTQFEKLAAQCLKLEQETREI
jgi:hypothetical protein